MLLMKLTSGQSSVSGLETEKISSSFCGFCHQCDSFLTCMMNCETSVQVWNTIQVYFATQIRAKVRDDNGVHSEWGGFFVNQFYK